MSKKSTIRVTRTNKSEISEEADWAAFDALSDDEVLSAAQSDPDALPTTEIEFQQFRRVVDIKTMRKNLTMTQEQFARTFHLSLATLRDWEQNRSQPDQAARTLLQVIAYNPAFVQEALR